MYEIKHHGAVDGVTGSCHELVVGQHNSLLVDIGLFQGAEVSGAGADASQLAIEFDVSNVRALVVTHVHIDHVGRLPYLLAAGFDGPIVCSVPSAKLLPLVIEDALKVGVTRNRSIIEACLERLAAQVVAVEYYDWYSVGLVESGRSVKVRLSPAGHILGSAYVTCRVTSLEERVAKEDASFVAERIPLPQEQGHLKWDVVFSGDLGAPYAPLLPAPRSPYRADQLVLESTYGDKNHENRANRRKRLQSCMEHALSDGGVVLIPAFSIGRTQELLYEIESIIYAHQDQPVSHTASGTEISWSDLDIIVDSPLASRFTEVYKDLKPYWDKEARRRVASGRHPLSFEQLTTIDGHTLHLQTVDYLAQQKRPAVVIAASGMCAGGRILNYLKALLGDPRNDVLFVGYQAQGTPGRDILRYHDRPNGYVMLDGERYPIEAKVWQLGGYSAHAGQKDLVNFVTRMRYQPSQIKLVHGDEGAKWVLQQVLREAVPGCDVVIG
ncbi:MBL fold metallo-hydrolase RNA specificity domain-containing protein [Rhodanobacter aciditrophus]|uniref:MBL fold metallo-hydrolase RNA specificity domain-containing protein n=1 Tax=Rhodanobacter aciditrophus TaxID=1623218 RepID=A0ABW4B0Z0_9GAMM